MFKILFILTCLVSGSAFAQNMADKESFAVAYQDLPDGSSRYVGKCSTHEDYEKMYFKKGKSLQAYVEPSDLSDAELKDILAKFDSNLIAQLFTALDMYDIAGKSASEVVILKEYFDDFQASMLVHTQVPGLELVRIAFGVGGGNGGYMVFNRTQQGPQSVYQMMSYTFDGDLIYCDHKVWMK